MICLAVGLPQYTHLSWLTETPSLFGSYFSNRDSSCLGAEGGEGVLGTKSGFHAGQTSTLAVLHIPAPKIGVLKPILDLGLLEIFVHLFIYFWFSETGSRWRQGWSGTQTQAGLKLPTVCVRLPRVGNIVRGHCIQLGVVCFIRKMLIGFALSI